MVTTVIIAIVVSVIFYLLLGILYKKEVVNLADIIPILKGNHAKVKNDKEFSASTVAQSISLATVILAFFQLIPNVGLWLFWAVITTAMGFGLFALLSGRIWDKLANYTHRPSIHEYIAKEYASKNAGLIASISTAIGYLCMFATELIVSSTFISGLVPYLPAWSILLMLTLVSFAYTSLGGFRVVVVSDRIQMWSIWGLIIAMLTFYVVFVLRQDAGFLTKTIPVEVRTFSFSNTSIAFVVGLLIMNLFTYVVNMALWQRVAGTESPNTFIKGVRKSIFQSALSWGLIVVLAILAYTVAAPPESVDEPNFLVNTIISISSYPAGNIVIFFVSIGLLGAMLSTASTQLIAVSHTIYEDIIAPFREKQLNERVSSHAELRFSRFILFLSAIGAIGIVQLLSYLGFQIADLAFSIYGAGLSLAPPILFSLFLKKDRLNRLSNFATVAVILGFFSAWGAAIYGIYILKQPFSNYVFLAPVIGLSVSLLCMLLGLLLNRR